ncbi:MAG: hypothetical protein GQ528_03585, partial [Woeseiaceae bacterium]|nr:hypothetical protein [Woeseiaceae bacterium]
MDRDSNVCPLRAAAAICLRHIYHTPQQEKLSRLGQTCRGRIADMECFDDHGPADILRKCGVLSLFELTAIGLWSGSVQRKGMKMSRQIDFCPSVYEHAARLIDKSPWQVSRDPDLLAQAHVRAFEIYRHSPVVLGIDIYNLEAEAYGAVVKRPADNGIPAIGAPPCQSLDDLLQIPPLDPKRDGRIPMVIGAGKEVARRLPEADVRIP